MIMIAVWYWQIVYKRFVMQSMFYSRFDNH